MFNLHVWPFWATVTLNAPLEKNWKTVNNGLLRDVFLGEDYQVLKKHIFFLGDCYFETVFEYRYKNYINNKTLLRVFESLPRDQYVNLWCLLYFRNIWSSPWKLLLHCYHSLRKHPFLVPSGEERGETDVFAGCCYQCGIGKYFGWGEGTANYCDGMQFKKNDKVFLKKWGTYYNVWQC